MVCGMMRVRNEARWIERCIGSILPLCDQVLVMDDHSTDGTPDLCAALPGVTVFPSPFFSLDEARDKNWLLDRARGADWIVSIDGDEMLMPGAAAAVRAAMEQPNYPCISLGILYLWDREDQVRMDGVYGEFRRESLFRPGEARFVGTHGCNFHCGNVPAQLRHKKLALDAALLHFGYMHRADRERKYAWYNAQDPNNLGEDQYRHMVIGDLFPAESRFMHAGPLTLRAL